MDNKISSTFSTSIPHKGDRHTVLPTLCSPYTQARTAKCSFNSIYKFADAAALVDWMSNNAKMEYSKEIESSVVWCADNSLSLSVRKMKEVVIEISKHGGVHASVYINDVEMGDVVMIKSFMFLGRQFVLLQHIDAMARKHT